ncbi:MAG: SDR family oxidoreductase [Candidatus Aerophobus sp.]|nr:MAG: SDR family oxidoreductase [Candidatus Aerophobus sp.]
MKLEAKKELNGRIAVITGGGGGIGKAIATAFAREGAKVILADIESKGAKEIVKRINNTQDPRTAFFIQADMRCSEDVATLFEKTVKIFGKCDILVCNAGVTRINPIDAITEEELDWQVDTNLKGYLRCCREAVKIMKKKKTRGVILFISSKNGIVGTYDKAVYCATKGGELTAARSLAMELGKFGIRVNSICPDAVLKDSRIWQDEEWIEKTSKRYQVPREKLQDYYRNRSTLKVCITPEDIAEAAVFLASDRASKITGTILPVDGGVAFPRG